MAPLYDLLSNTYYPELSRKMTMKNGGEYESDKVVSKHFDKIPEEAGLAKPLVKKRALELAQAALLKSQKVPLGLRGAEPVAEFVLKRCTSFISKLE